MKSAWANGYARCEYRVCWQKKDLPKHPLHYSCSLMEKENYEHHNSSGKELGFSESPLAQLGGPPLS